MTLKDSHSAISSPESAAGRSHCVGQAGRIAARHGQHHAHASLSARQAEKKDLLTSGTYGPPHIGLSASEILSLSLASNLAALTRMTGSTLYKLTWKPWAMHSGRLRFRLRASVLRTSETVRIGWPTPLANNGKGAGNFNRQGGGKPSDSSVINWLADAGRERIRTERLAKAFGEKGEILDQIWKQRVRPDAGAVSASAGRLAHANDNRQQSDCGAGCGGQCTKARDDAGRRCQTGSMADSDSHGRKRRLSGRAVPQRKTINGQAGCGCTDCGTGPVNSFWSDADWLHCQDGKWRPVRPGSFPLANGVPARVGRLRAYGNAINIEAAAAFIKSYMAAVDHV